MSVPRVLLALALIIPLAACSGRTGQASGLIPPEDIHAALTSVDLTSARTQVIAFLRGYAGASRDGAATLEGSVRDPELSRWARWVRFQNDQLSGPLQGRATIRSIRFLDLRPTAGEVVARFDVDASVSFVYRPAGEEPVPREYGFQGPMLLVREGLADWAVVDATRDGIPMSSSINVLSLFGSSGGVSVALDSVFAFQQWSFNVVVRNGGEGPISLDVERTELFEEGDEGGVDQHPQAASATLQLVPPSSAARGQVIFPTPIGTVTGIRFIFVDGAGDDRTIEFDFRAEAMGGVPPTTAAA